MLQVYQCRPFVQEEKDSKPYFIFLIFLKLEQVITYIAQLNFQLNGLTNFNKSVKYISNGQRVIRPHLFFFFWGLIRSHLITGFLFYAASQQKINTKMHLRTSFDKENKKSMYQLLYPIHNKTQSSNILQILILQKKMKYILQKSILQKF